MTKLTLLTLLTASMLSTASADMGFGGIMKDMMDVPKDMITEGTDAMKEMKNSAKDAVEDAKDAATDMKDSAKDATTDMKDNIKDNIKNDDNKSDKVEVSKDTK